MAFELEELTFLYNFRVQRDVKLKSPHTIFSKPVCLFVCLFSRQGFSVALEPVLELALVDQAGLD